MVYLLRSSTLLTLSGRRVMFVVLVGKGGSYMFLVICRTCHVGCLGCDTSLHRTVSKHCHFKLYPLLSIVLMLVFLALIKLSAFWALRARAKCKNLPKHEPAMSFLLGESSLGWLRNCCINSSKVVSIFLSCLSPLVNPGSVSPKNHPSVWGCCPDSVVANSCCCI